MLDLNNKIVGVPLSAGINSAGVLCWLIESGMKPKEIHIFYAHFKEHSPDSMKFVEDLIELAKKHFDVVYSKITMNSVLQFFRDQKMIPHPITSPCSRMLKIAPMLEYNYAHGVEVDLVGYVRTEKSRIKRMSDHREPDMFLAKEFPISDQDDEWCFEIVKKMLGWYPAIYDIRDKNGKRVFKHNNCLPCKNMQLKQMQEVEVYYPEYMREATELSRELKGYWGRDADAFYLEFGREDINAAPCEICNFD